MILTDEQERNLENAWRAVGFMPNRTLLEIVTAEDDFEQLLRTLRAGEDNNPANILILDGGWDTDIIALVDSVLGNGLWLHAQLPSLGQELAPFFDMLRAPGGLRNLPSDEPAECNIYDAASDSLTYSARDIAAHMGIPVRTVLLMLLTTTWEGLG